MAERHLWYSRDNGRHWEALTVKSGTFLFHVDIPPNSVYDDGYGHLYRDMLPDREE